MALFVYITDQCKMDARTHSYEDRIGKFAQRIEKEQHTTLFDNFPPNYLKKRFERQIRLLAAERRIGEHIVVCFYRLLVRGNAEYESFIADSKSYGEINLAPLVSDDQLAEWLESKRQAETIPEKPKPTPEESGYLWNVFSQEQAGPNEVLICETEDWVKSIGEKHLQDRTLFTRGS